MPFVFKSRQEINPNSWSLSHFLKTSSNNKVQMKHIDDQLKVNICSILPSISKETVSGIIQALKYVGLESLSDLQLVQEEDLILVLKPIQRRKLVKVWGEQNNSNHDVDEIKKIGTYLSPHLRNEEHKQDESISSSKTENNFDCKVDEVKMKASTFIHPHLKNEENRQDESVMSSKIESNSNHEDDEIEKAGPYIPPDFINEENKQDESMISSKTEIMSPVTVSSILSEKNSKWNKKRIIYLLQLYTKRKLDLSLPDGDQTVWKKIAHELKKCSELECRNKIDELRFKYERIEVKNENVTNRETAMFLDEAKRAFETTDIGKKILNFMRLRRSNKDFLCKLLQLYAKHKTKLTCPEDEERTIWEIIAKEMREKFSYACGETMCHFELLQLKRDYEKVKKHGVMNKRMMYLFDDAREAFEASENLENSNPHVNEISKKIGIYVPPHLRNRENNQSESMMSSTTKNGAFKIKVTNLSEKVEKSDLQDLFGHFGKIVCISKIKHAPGESNGFSFITFHKQEDAAQAIQIVNGHEYDKLILKVEWAESSQTNEVLD